MLVGQTTAMFVSTLKRCHLASDHEVFLWAISDGNDEQPLLSFSLEDWLEDSHWARWLSLQKLTCTRLSWCRQQGPLPVSYMALSFIPASKSSLSFLLFTWLLFCLSTHFHLFLPSFSLFVLFFPLTNSSSLVSCSWHPERGLPATTVRSWRRSSSTTRRSDASLITDICPRTSTIRERSWGLWKRLAVGSTYSLLSSFSVFGKLS